MSITFSITSEGDIINDHHLIAQVLREALPYIDFLKGKTLVVKLGGSALEYQRSVLQDIIWLRALGANPVLVHGGGPYINEWLKKLNLPARFEQGLRVTDAATLDVVRMVLLGQVNQGLVLMTSSLGGHAESVDPMPVQTLIDQGYIPIIAPLGQGPDDTCLNINADLVAAHLAGALNAEKLIFLSNVVGICRQDGTLISELGELEAKKLIEDGVISGGMIPKVSACLDALLAVPRVHIVDGRESHILLRELFTDEGAGTMIRRGE